MNLMRAFKVCFVTLQSGLTDFLAFPWSEFPHFLVVNFPPILHAWEQEGDSYSIMFHEAADAVKFCLQVGSIRN